FVHRHPLNACAASFVGHWTVDWSSLPSYEEDSTAGALRPDDPWIRYPEMLEVWRDAGPLGRIAYNCLERNAAAIEFTASHPTVPHLTLAAEDQVFKGLEYVEHLSSLIGIPLATGEVPNVPRNAGWVRSLEERPLGDSWSCLPELAEVVHLAEQLGYVMSEQALRSRADRYQLPDSIASRIRFATRYWQHRRAIAAWLRTRGVIPQANAQTGGARPRSLAGAFREAMQWWS